MGVHPWPAIDPASAYMTMTGGAGAAPMHVASAALSTLGGAVDATVATSGVNDVVVGENWSGMGRIAAAASVTTLNTDQTTYAQLSLLKAQLLQAAGELHTLTPPRMVTHVQANANRGEYLVDNAINPLVFGALTPRLVDLDTEYFGFMWPNNASAGLTYGAGLDGIGAALAALSALPTMAGGSVAAPAMAAADVAANAGITMASAAMSATEQAATAAISPATTAASTATTNLLGNTPLTAPATPNSSIQPMAAVHTSAPVAPSAPALGQAQAPVMGMFAPPPSAAVTPPAPSPGLPATAPPVAAAPPMPAAAPGVTSYVPPAQPFSPPPPTAGRATGLKPGMLNAAALRGPVSTMPLTTTATSTLATAAQPLAYVPPEPPRPVATPPPPQPPLNTSGTAHTLNPPPAPPQQPSPPPAQPSPIPPAAPQNGPPPSNNGGGPGPGLDIQMLGTGLGGAPLAPPGIPPMPLDPTPPLPPIEDMNEQQARAALDQLNADQAIWNSQCGEEFVGPLQPGPYSACMARLDGLNARRAAIIGRLNQLGIPVENLPPGVTAPPAAHPGPPEPPNTSSAPGQPGSQQPNSPTGPSLDQQAAQIGRDVMANVPKGSRLNTLVDRLSQLHIGDQQQAAEAAEAAGEAAWGETGGIVNGPSGAKLVLPADPRFGEAIMVAPDGTLSVFRGDLYQFLPK